MARRGVSQQALAVLTGMSQSSLSKRLRGVVAFDVEEVVTISAALGVTVADLWPMEAASRAAS